MNIRAKVFAALMHSKTLNQMLSKDSRGQGVYHIRSPSAGNSKGSYPIIVYQVISDVPAVMADGVELERQVTMRINIVTNDGVYDSIYREVRRIMLSLGFLRAKAEEIKQDGLFIKQADFCIGIGVND